MKNMAIALIFIVTVLGIIPAYADYPRPWQMWLQKPATDIMDHLTWFNDLVHWLAAGVLILVFLLLAYVCIRFSRANNPVPSKSSHNTTIEIIWTVVPVIILIGIAIPSLKLLRYANVIPETEMNLKVIGHQWYWEYVYPDHGDFSFMSVIIPDNKLQPGQKRLLEVDNRVVVPVGTNIKVLITSGDVIHSWAVPSFGIKTDAVPGRTNEAWIHIREPGVYYGQCSELCGINHGFMPIVIEALPIDEFNKWVEQAKTSFSFNTPVFPNAFSRSFSALNPSSDQRLLKEERRFSGKKSS